MSNLAEMVSSFRNFKPFILDWPVTVPVVAIFTKFDDLITQVYDMDIGEEENIQVAYATLEKKFEMPLKGYKFPPRAYVRFECMSLSFSYGSRD